MANFKDVAQSSVAQAKLRKKTSPKYKALNHFDEFYGSVFGNKWVSMKTALLRNSKYVALVNNYGSPEETTEYLVNRGAHCLNKLMEVQQQYQDENPDVVESSEPKDEYNSKLERISEKIQSDEISNLYSHSDTIPDKIELSDMTLQNKLEKMSDTDPNKFEIDQSRIIDPSLGLTTESLWQYVPATKLKGMEDWVPESMHFSYYA
ncbi:hypothetical protein EVAR_93287_1 [Eumeta japonica]|uniref:Uncharacterized protein n=1 Tax=Eumeta variegata TaxID=151549 RepID=A0A4C1UTD4_EUMVA|nr:hypothetical protein EVAR_93287_1 [Eumeta japonica]